MKITKAQEPAFIFNRLNETPFSTWREPLIGRYFNNAKGKIGKQSIEIRLEMMDDLAWHELTWLSLQGF